MFFFQQLLHLLLFSVPSKKLLHNTGVYKRTSVTHFAKNSKLELFTWTQLFSKSCAKVYKEVRGWNAKQEDGG